MLVVLEQLESGEGEANEPALGLAHVVPLGASRARSFPLEVYVF